MQNLLKELTDLLAGDDRLVSEGKLLKNKIIELALALDPRLLKGLLSSEEIKVHFFTFVEDIVVFDKLKFQKFVSNKAFLPDSYTAYKNKIGLTSGDDYIADNKEAVLAWAYKDCVLEGGQSKDEDDREEVFWNETLAPEQIDRLLSPKVLTNWKRFDCEGEQSVTAVKADANLIIKGNNLIALHSLKAYREKVKLIYIDPPYNTGSDSFGYNDSFNHSTWLTFMANRLKVAKELLRGDGAICVQVDDNEQAYLKVLLDEVFGSANFVNTISIKTKVSGVSGSHHGKSLANTVEYIHLYAKNRELFEFEQTLQSKTPLAEYITDYEAEGKSWKYTSVITHLSDGEYVCSIKDGSGEEIKIYKHSDFQSSSIQSVARAKFEGDRFKAYEAYIDKVYRTTNAQSSIRGRVMEATRDWPEQVISIEYVPKSGKNKGIPTKLYYKDRDRNLIMWLKDTVDVGPEGTISKMDNLANLWTDVQYNNLTREGNVQFQNGKKPERIIYNLISLITKKDELVLDYHLGSGTTAAVALKMGRRFIGIEQMDYIEDISVGRLQRVIQGEEGGVSSLVGWQGGGEFLYCELAQANEVFVQKILSSTTSKELLAIWKDMEVTAFLSHKVNPKEIDNTKSDFEDLSLEDQKKLLLQTLDMNMLYVPLSEIDDETYKISDTDKALNRSFYKAQ